MLKQFAWRLLPFALVLVSGTARVAFAEDPWVVTSPSDGATATPTAVAPATLTVLAPATPTVVALDTATAVATPVTTAVATSTVTGVATSTVTAVPTAVATATAGAVATPTALAAPDGDPGQWTAYGFNITSPSSMWPMLEMLHTYHFDWELYSAEQRPTPLMWSSLSPGVFGQYSPKLNVVRMSYVLQNESVELGAAFLAHELTHLTDDLNGKLGDMTGDLCYAAETRAFVNEANFWEMVVGPDGKSTDDAIESEENAKMFAFVGNSHFADLVLRTTSSYIKQCGR